MKKWIINCRQLTSYWFRRLSMETVRVEYKNRVSASRTSVVQKGTLNVNISGSGTVQAVTSEDIKTKFENNEVDEVLTAVGEKVNKGEELITFSNGSDPITAPATGIITTIAVSAGEPVTNGQVVAHVTNYKNYKPWFKLMSLIYIKLKRINLLI